MIEAGLIEYTDKDHIIDIRDKNQIIKAQYCIGDDALYKYRLMVEHCIEFTFYQDRLFEFVRADYIEWQGAKFWLRNNYKPVAEDIYKYKYELKFEATEMLFQDIQYFYLNQGGIEAEWSLMNNAENFLQIAVDDINRYFKTTKFVIGSIEADDIVINIKFNPNTTVFAALKQIADAFDCEWYLSGYTLHLVKKLSFGDEIEFENEVSVLSMDRSEGENTFRYNRILALGSTRNIPANYRATEEGEAVDAIYQKRLRIPKEKGNMIDVIPGLSPEEAIEGVVIFDDVYPKRIGTIEAIETIPYTDTNEETGVVTKWFAYKFKDSGLLFKEDYLLPGIELKLTFQSGKLNGKTFSLFFHPNGFSKTDNSQCFEIARNEDYGRPLPNDIIKPELGDEYVLWGFNIALVGDQYVPAGEQELYDTTQKWIEKELRDKSVYECPTVIDYFTQNEYDLEVGQKVKLIQDTVRSSRIMGFEKKLLNKYDATYIVGDNAIASRWADVEDSIKTLEIGGQLFEKSGSGNVYLLKTLDNTPPTEHNAYSAKASDHRYLNKRTGGTVDGHTYFREGIKVQGDAISDSFGNSTFTAGAFGSGFKAWVDKQSGLSYAEFDHILARRGLDVVKLNIAEIDSVGGQILLSLANMFVTKVEEALDTFVCYFENDNGKIPNKFALDDQVICRSFEGGNIKYYWTRVVGIGADYIRISIADKDGNVVPAYGDNIIQFGNRTNVNRQHAILLSAYGSDAPSIKQYSGINSYDLTGKEKTVISPKGNKFTGTFIIEASGKDIVSFVDESIDNIKIGGRNLIIRHNEQKNKMINPSSVIQEYGGSSLMEDFIEVTAGETLCFSKYGSNNPYDSYFRFAYYKEDKETLVLRKANQGASFKEIVPSEAMYLRVSYPSGCKVKLEKGNVVTDWSESYEDTQAAINSKVAYTEYNSKMQVLENEISLKASQSNLNALGEQVSELDAELVVQAGQITSAVTKAEHAQNTANSKNTIYQSDIEPTIPSGGFTIGDIWRRESLTDMNGNIDSDATKNIFRLENRWDGTAWIPIGINVSGSYITQTAESIDLVVDDAVNEVKNGITVNTDGITAFGEQFKVDTDLIANAIQTERLKVGDNVIIESDGTIKAKNAELEGDLTIVWDGDTTKPVRRISVVDKSTGYDKTKVIISPTDIRKVSQIAASEYNELVAQGGASVMLTTRDDIKVFEGRTFSLQHGLYYDLIIPEIGITAERGTSGFGVASCELALVNYATGSSIPLGYWDAFDGDVLISKSFTLNGVPPASYFLRATVEAHDGGRATIIIAQNRQYTIRPIQDAIEIGKNGILGVFTTERWFHFSTDGQYTRMGNYGFRITSAGGIQYSSNMYLATPTWKTLT